MIVVFGRKGDRYLKSVQREFDNPRLYRMTRYFVCIYLEMDVQNNSFSHPQFSVYRPGPGGHRVPLIFFANAKEKVLDKTEGDPKTTELGQMMAKVLKEHGEVADPKALSKASAMLKAAEKLHEKGELSRAAPLYQEIVRLAPNAPIGEKAGKKLAEVEAIAARELEAARLDIADKAYPDAVGKLKAICTSYRTLKVGKEAAAELARLEDVPEAQDALEGKTEAATTREVDTSDYVFTDEELDALDDMGRSDGVVRTGGRDDAAKAERMLRMARNWIANKQNAEARKLLRQITTQYPTTTQASTARNLLDGLK
jgi:hypothetical protein